MAEAIINLYSMHEIERENMGRRGQEYVKKYHSMEFLVDELEKYCFSIMGYIYGIKD